MLTVTNDKIKAPKIEDLFNTYLSTYSSVTNDIETLKKIKHMLKRDNVSRYCIELIFLYMFSRLSDFHHDKEAIKADVNTQIEQSKGNWVNQLRGISSAFWYGYSWSEISCNTTIFNRKQLNEIFTVDPTKYTFTGINGEIKELELEEANLKLDYNTGIHVVIGSDLSFDYVLGSGFAIAALPYWELQQLMMQVTAIAGQRQATPILVKKTETDADIILIDEQTGIPKTDDYGQPILIKKGWDAIRQLEALGSAGVTAIDRDDDLFAIELKIDGEFIQSVITQCQQNRMMSFLTPATLVTITNSGVGDSGLSERHLELFEGMIVAMLKALMDQIVDDLFRPLIIYNFGEQKNYGYFEINAVNPNSLEIAKVIIESVNKKVFKQQDLEVINKLRLLLDLPEVDESYFEETASDSSSDESSLIDSVS